TGMGGVTRPARPLGRGGHRAHPHRIRSLPARLRDQSGLSRILIVLTLSPPTPARAWRHHRVAVPARGGGTSSFSEASIQPLVLHRNPIVLTLSPPTPSSACRHHRGADPASGGGTSSFSEASIQPLQLAVRFCHHPARPVHFSLSEQADFPSSTKESGQCRM